MSNQTPNFQRGLLKYVKGDATLPRGGGHRMLMHICNDVGAFGAGIALAIAKRWPKVRDQYKFWYRAQVIDRNKFELGSIQIVDIQSDLSVINMISQKDIVSSIDENGEEIPPIRYDALEMCLQKVAKIAKDNQSSIHCGKIGSGLAGGDWTKIESLINKYLVERGLNVTVYEFDVTNEQMNLK